MEEEENVVSYGYGDYSKGYPGEDDDNEEEENAIIDLDNMDMNDKFTSKKQGRISLPSPQALTKRMGTIVSVPYSSASRVVQNVWIWVCAVRGSRRRGMGLVGEGVLG